MSTGELFNRYRKLILNLWPLGKVWENVSQSDIGDKLVNAFAKEPCRVAERGQDLLVELDPLTADEMLDDWETLLGLPDECTPEFQTIDERREQARAKLADQGGQSAAFFEEIASQLGFPDTVVSDYRSFTVGRSVVSDRLTNDFSVPFLVGQGVVGDVLLNEGWQFYFQVNSPASVVDPFEVGQNTVGEPLVEFGNELLQCTMKKLKPAHTGAFFTFD